jgi:hypothetical protein
MEIYIYRRGLESIKKHLKNSTTNQKDSDVATATAEQIIPESTSPGRKSQFFQFPGGVGNRSPYSRDKNKMRIQEDEEQKKKQLIACPGKCTTGGSQ